MQITSAALESIATQLGTMILALQDEESRVGSVVDGVRRRLGTIAGDWRAPRSNQTRVAVETYVDVLDTAPGAVSDACEILRQLQTHAYEVAGLMQTNEQQVASVAALRALGGDIDPSTADAGHRARERLRLLADDWRRECIVKTITLTGSIDQLTKCGSAFIDGLPARVLPDDRHDQLVLWFGKAYGVDISVLEADPPDPPTAGQLKLDELYDLAYNTPGLPDEVRQKWEDEYEFFSMLHLGVLRGGYAEEQLQGAENAYLAGAPRQYVEDLLWGLDGFSAFLGSPDEDEQNVFVELDYEIRRYVGLAIAEGRTFGPGLPDYVVVEVSAGHFGVVGGGVFIVSSSGTVFSGVAGGIGTPGPGINARAGYINPSGESYSGDEVDDFVRGFAVSASGTAPPLSVGFSLPLVPFQPFDPGRSAAEIGLGAFPGADLSLVHVRESGVPMPQWAPE